MAKKNQDVDKEVNKPKRTVIEFIKPYKRYSNGDIAGFDPKVAKGILELEPAVAEAYQPQGETNKQTEE